MDIFIIAIIIVVLVAWQVCICRSTYKKCELLANIFEDSDSNYKVKKFYIPKKEISTTSYSDILSKRRQYENKGDTVKIEKVEVSDYENSTTSHIEKVERVICKAKDKEEVSLISLSGDNSILQEITRVINNYLIRNKGAASDFGLIKDAVERNCGSLEEEIDTQTPWPLYFGLMGTMLGIIVGIGKIGLFVGFEQFVQEPSSHIGGLMGDVALAMIVSAIGIASTTALSWLAKNKKMVLEARKNKFYSWFQSELMPIISKESASEGLKRLENNLSKFNNTFEENVKELSSTFSIVKETSSDQALLLQTLQRMDLKKMAEANISILSRFNETIGQLEDFNSYIDYAIKGLKDIQQRNAAISEAVSSVDNTLDKSFNQLKTGVEQQISALKESLSTSEREMEKLVASESRLFEAQGSKIEAFFKTMQDLKPLIDGLNDWKTELNKQTKSISRLSEAIDNLPQTNGGGHVVVEHKLSKQSKIIIGVISVSSIIALAGVLYHFW